MNFVRTLALCPVSALANCLQSLALTCRHCSSTIVPCERNWRELAWKWNFFFLCKSIHTGLDMRRFILLLASWAISRPRRRFPECPCVASVLFKVSFQVCTCVRTRTKGNDAYRPDPSFVAFYFYLFCFLTHLSWSSFETERLETITIKVLLSACGRF